MDISDRSDGCLSQIGAMDISDRSDGCLSRTYADVEVAEIGLRLPLRLRSQ